MARDEKDIDREEQVQKLIEMGIKCLLACGALFLTFAAGIIGMMRSINSGPCYGPHTWFGPDLNGGPNPPLGGYSASVTETCGVCGSVIARGAQICPYCQRKPDCSL